jgi:hypothetical protein
MALVAPLEQVSGRVYNTGSSFMNFTLRQLADMIQRLEPELDVDYVDNDDIRNYRVSFERIRRELGFQCHVSLESGVQSLREALRQGQVRDYREPVYSNYQTLLAQVRQARQPMAPGADLTAPQFSKNSLWWSMNHTNGHAGSNGDAAKAAVKPVPRVAAAGG